MGRTAITRGSLYNGSIMVAFIHLIFSVFSVLVGLYILKDFSIKEIESCLFLLFTAVGIVSAICAICGLYARSSVLSLVALILVFLEAIGFIVLFGLYFFNLFAKSKAIMVGDQNFLMSINALQIFLSLYFTFAYSRSFRYLYPTQEHSQA
ncbi:hypothetical protein PENTCL1PPCAC_29319 [Pristionchus entomophagus]|uniref:MARVEL domain-containing protein n=1 Tax=Pristionchus entomophagus TaxID=358040 RepID=A0AAV5UJC6_9BILA|nr:hypothetical protein PENTCL1PPCAC_29319 [Pristionchus entomophagus]